METAGSGDECMMFRRQRRIDTMRQIIKRIKAHRELLVQTLLTVFMYLGVSWRVKEELTNTYYYFTGFGGVIHTIYYISAVLGCTVWLAHFWNHSRKTALAAHVFLAVCMICRLVEVINECWFDPDEPRELVFVFVVPSGIALLTELSIIACRQGKNLKIKPVCIRMNCAVSCFILTLYFIFSFGMIEEPYARACMLFYIGMLGTFLTIAWEEGQNYDKTYR